MTAAESRRRRPTLVLATSGALLGSVLAPAPGLAADTPSSRGAHTPNVVHPLAGSRYSDIRSFRPRTATSDGRPGTEIKAACGSPVRSATPGKVRVITGDPSLAWAGPSLVKVFTTRGRRTLWYAHLATVTVVDGQTVQSGDQLGTVGDQGEVSGCRLGLQSRTDWGRTVSDPSRWLANNVGRPVADRTLFGNGGFTLVSFNVLGAAHTAPGGKNAGMPDAEVRTPRSVRKLEEVGADVVGFQELFRSQRADFYRRMRGGWTFFPFSREADTENSIVWRQSTFRFVDGGTFPVAWFDGRPRLRPYVLLREKSTGRTAWFLNAHNPATTRKHRKQGRFRDQAIQQERAKIAELRATGRPVFFTGDLNDVGRAFCPLTVDRLVSAATGGSGSPSCVLPYEQGIDWVFGSGPTAFSRYVRDRSTKGPMSDHPMIIAQAHLAG